MKKVLEIFESNIWLRVLTIVSISLMIAGFIVPPTGVIDGSVLTAGGELAGFGMLWLILLGIEKGIDVTASKGDATIHIEQNDDDNNNNTSCNCDNCNVIEDSELIIEDPIDEVEAKTSKKKTSKK